MGTHDLDLLRKAAEKLVQLKKLECFDANNLDSSPTAAQLQVLKDAEHIISRFVTAGNQSIPGWSKVLMADSSLKEMKDVEEGDAVMCFDYATHKAVPGWVTKKHNHGQKEVFRYWMDDDNYADRTDYHEMVIFEGRSGYRKVRADETSYFLSIAENKKVVSSFKEKVESLGVHEIFDITVSHEDSVYICDGYLTGNSGKSQLSSREVIWVLTETHPYWKRPKEVGNSPLQILVIGRIQKQIEEVLWRKMKGFLNEDDIHVDKKGGAIQKITYKPNGNSIIFISHHNVNEARDKIQAYTADWVWIDELPGSFKLIEEAQRRIQARNGRFIATFTPKVLNKEIRAMVDNSRPPVAKKYQFSMFDNPIYSAEKKAQLLQELETLPEAYRRTILYGDWYAGDFAVYHIPENLVQNPVGYHPSWRHLEMIDPALSSKAGVVLLAEEPNTGTWYIVKDEYLTNLADPNELYASVKKLGKDINIVDRVCDPEANWYHSIARTDGIYYKLPNKVGRKGELIKNLQTALTQGIIKVAPWCSNVVKELESCQWSETRKDTIVNSHSFHLLDCLQYGLDFLPKQIVIVPPKDYYQVLREENEKRKRIEAASAKQKHSNSAGRRKWKLRRI